MQTQLPQPTLARIWSLSDTDADGRLSCDEFILAMHLCDTVRTGDKLPDVLPPELMPATLRRTSLAGTALVEPIAAQPISSATDLDLKPMSPVTFEDKRKENFDKVIILLLKHCYSTFLATPDLIVNTQRY